MDKCYQITSIRVSRAQGFKEIRHVEIIFFGPYDASIVCLFDTGRAADSLRDLAV